LPELDGLTQLLGIPVKDYFGREIGKVICYSHDGKGEIKTVLVTSTNGDIIEYTKDDIQVSSSDVVVKDKLVTSAHALRKEIEINVKRMQALEELRSSSKIHPRVYTELKTDFENERSSLDDAKKGLTGLADDRRVEVARKLMALEKIRASIEVQVMSGEIDQSVYRYASSEAKSAIDRLTNELENLERELSFLDVEIEEMPKAIMEVQQQEEAPSTEVAADEIEKTESKEGIIPGQEAEINAPQEPEPVTSERPLRVRLV